ncbi:DEAD/DEAH box helicase [Frankia sp. Cppng1_Ct_nod]|uniref:DEAD/DEAH box helicase n=1 Tax=Frankia sp. Cppng1_Ct_nod TaxID=2897162 RepID=UPI001F5F8B19|nr:DEAD/DEAH box helicase [Frankia sp. Cppng1_Ct_nod]
MAGSDTVGLRAAVTDHSYLKGVRYAQRDAVMKLEWNVDGNTLRGRVRGSNGEVYSTSVQFSDDGVSSRRFRGGSCTCPVGANCKHVVALVLTAESDDAAAPRRQSRRSEPPQVWIQSLGELLGSPSIIESGRSRTDFGTTPLAVELSFAAHSSAGGAASERGLQVTARLVKPGKNGWVGAVGWDELNSPYRVHEFHEPHVRLLQEMFALYRARQERYGYSYYSNSGHKRLDLSEFESRQLWPMLDAAAEVGIRFVHARKKLGDVDRYGLAELCLDVTRAGSSGSLLVAPLLRIEGSAGTDAAVFSFIGGDGHGVVYVDRAEIRASEDHRDWHVRLARLVEPVPPQLQRMTVGNRSLEVPVAEEARFRTEFCPRLQRLAPVVSRDGSFVPPEVAPPTLLLRAAYGDGHDLDLAWEWAYEVGGERIRVPLYDAEPDGFRDLRHERDVLAALDLPADAAAVLSAGRESAGEELISGLTLRSGVRLSSTDTMRVTTELLPWLAGRPGVAVEVSGDPADYREAGDSLRIGLSTDDVVGETDWFDLGVTITVEGRQVPFADVFLALSQGQSHLLLADGAYFSLQKPELQALRRLIEEARALQDSPAGQLRISRFQAGLWDELAELGVVEHQAHAWRQQVTGLLSLSAVDQHEPPSTLAATLRPYQLEGFRWLAFLWQYQLGGVLADDMGLGKTLQTLALLCHAKRVDPELAPFLVVAPTSVVSNWAAEAARFAPGLRTVTISDTERRRGGTLEQVVSDADLVVTSYTLFRLEYDKYANLPWSGLVLDEAQMVKNHQSKAYQCARLLPASFKLAVTGTPMENNLMELWSLLSVTAPGLFPNPTRFRDYYAQPIEKQSDAELLAQLRRRIRPLMTRRTKEQVAPELPPKQEQVLEVDLHPRHRKLYQTHLQRERQKVLGLVEDMNRNRFTILRSLTLLRQLSLHAGLVDDSHDDIPSAKIDALLEQLVDVIDGGHRALVFSQFTGFLGKVRDRLSAVGVEHCYLDGKTRNRPAVLERFKKGSAPVFLVSLKAGGFGLNLTEADYCFLLDPWWNPATEAQAVDRTHRIGQTRNVMVYRLVAKDTIEEKVMALKARKAELFSSVMDDGDAFGSSLDADDVRQLFS